MSATRAPGDGGYTIDEIALRTGLTSRTIRFYQTRGAIPAPARQGRRVIYGDEHVRRLEQIAKLRGDGLPLDDIIELLDRPPAEDRTETFEAFLDRVMQGWRSDQPALWTRDEVVRAIGFDHPDLISGLEATGAVAAKGYGQPRMYVVSSPTLIRIAGRFLRLGVDGALVFDGYNAMRGSMAKLADELVALYRGPRLGPLLNDPSGFAHSTDELRAASSDALLTIFVQEMARATYESIMAVSPQSIKDPE
jgi:DNA-binding transcriptional MerR regulator